MKVLFVSSGNSSFFEMAPFIKSQGESLKKNGVELDYYSVKGKGFGGYISNISNLRKKIKEYDPDVIHTHYSLSGWVSLFANLGKPMVLSLMGSDTYGSVDKEGKVTFFSLFMRFQVYLIQFFFSTIIVKSENLRKTLWKQQGIHVIPNGVDFELFKPLDKKKCRLELNLPLEKKIILFIANTKNLGKNFNLLQKAMAKIPLENIEICTPFPIEPHIVPLYYNACDVLVFPSFKEGSPNVIKEALACNTKIVATDCGDIVERTKGLQNVFISDYDENDLAIKIERMLELNISINSREKIRGQLEENQIAKHIIKIYSEIINRGK